ncbi:isoleucine--tRNA ligase [Naumannella halotolerans]|uniref:Isoleucine--tRNA ligase n=1 Tax=Naumannella halotolerans TaxID=993414 RepID=A0A4V3EMF4_9ACTN|nr:isoleucine--tRNA ligase [Naumannella halotolerans]TDT29838.1 isoleucyl-tRNA synthetase [Naumannella halotolerans]
MTNEVTPEDASRTYAAVPAQIDLPRMEHEILQLWQRDDTFAKSLERTRDGDTWTFYEGPPTANGMPGTHHIEARVFKDVFPRFRTMQGYRVDRKAGWDCHGLPVELAVEKELGLNGKPDIENYGVEAFNERCRESVQRHVGAFTELTERMGYWVNLDEAYWTMDPEYVQSAWWALKQIFDAGLLTEDFRVTPYCPRCGTGLSDHELAQGYETITDPSVYVRLPLTSGPQAGKADLLIWTTTPWTLPSNALVAVKSDVVYTVAVKAGETPVVVAEPLLESALGEGWGATDTFTGEEMVGWTYERPFDLVELPGRGAFVVTEDYVTTDGGTGLVHQAPSFGADDFESARRNGVELINPIDEQGNFDNSVPLVGGMHFRAANLPLVDELKASGKLFKALEYEHSYPHCWRCHNPLMYYALPSWYIRTTKIKDELLRENEGTHWYPENVKWGRYGDWLKNNVDWALSRRRYWGTPLPIWRNDLDPSKLVAVGSLAELSELSGRDLSELDPHRPFVDDITFSIEGEDGTYVRVPEVIDAWFDSGSMPFAQWGYPHAPGSEAAFGSHYPADFICEAIDQTRGWFYTLMAVGTLVFDQNSYRNVLCLGHILAEDGRKMSKHLGNILEPIPLMDRHGADAVRWFMAAAGSPWMARRVGDKTINETVRKVLLTYWNTVAFQALYARANDWTPAAVGQVTSDHVLDRWLRSATNVLITEVTDAYENFDTQRIGQLLSEFVDELSNWYVRRSRRRFWDGDNGALQSLHDTLHVLTRLMAPLVPFITERVWQDLFVPVDPDGPASVHLADWPVTDESVVDVDLDQAMELTKRLVELGRSARAEAAVKTRQPLQRALVPSVAFEKLTEELKAELTAELNIQSVEPFSGAGALVDYEAKGNFRALGKRFGKQTPQMAAAIAAADAAQLSATLAAEGRASVDFDGGTEIGPDEVIISERPREGWSVVNAQGETVALDLELTPELVRAGQARDVVRFVQESRKNSGFDVSDRITLRWSAGDELSLAIREHGDLIADEVLAVSMDETDLGDDALVDSDLGVRIAIARV